MGISKCVHQHSRMKLWQQKMITHACNIMQCCFQQDSCPTLCLVPVPPCFPCIVWEAANTMWLGNKFERKGRMGSRSFSCVPQNYIYFKPLRTPGDKSIALHQRDMLNDQWLMPLWFVWFINFGFLFSQQVPAQTLGSHFWATEWLAQLHLADSSGPGNEDVYGDRSLDISCSISQEVCKPWKYKITTYLRIPAVIWKVDFANKAGTYAGPGGYRYI